MTDSHRLSLACSNGFRPTTNAVCNTCTDRYVQPTHTNDDLCASNVTRQQKTSRRAKNNVVSNRARLVCLSPSKSSLKYTGSVLVPPKQPQYSETSAAHIAHIVTTATATLNDVTRSEPEAMCSLTSDSLASTQKMYDSIANRT